jgi:catechol 2,3-dioxygenase-like lactoylglutathione lyase family enzyme
MITKLSHSTVYILDQDRAKDFYVNKLGFDVRDDARMGPFRWLTVGPKAQPDVRIILMAVAPGPTPVSTSLRMSAHCASSIALGGGVLVTDNLARDYEELKAKGVEFTEPPTKQPWGYAAVMKDDSGNYWSVGEES